MRILLALTILASTASAAICPHCGKDHGGVKSKTQSSAQNIAQVRVNWMADRGRVQHPPFSVGGIRQLGAFFEGVGMNGQTCQPRSGGYRKVADVSARRGGRVFNLRIWTR